MKKKYVRKCRVSPEQREKVVECMLLNMNPYEAAKKTGVCEESTKNIYSEESIAYAERREKEKRLHVRSEIIRTSSGLMYTR